jgi:hypothetical protein
MKIFHGGIQLTDWADYPAQNVSVNGQLVYEKVDIVRAATARYYSRGNKSVSLQFAVRREFATHAEAQVYLLTHFSLLPAQALTEIQCGAPGEAGASVFFYNAVLAASPQGSFNGVEVVIQYSIEAGEISTDAPPEDLVGDEEDVIKRGKQAIASGVDSVAVVFAESFPAGTTVIVNATVAKPSGSGSNLFATVRDDLVTINGFTVELGGPTPDSNHKLNWSAYGL